MASSRRLSEELRITKRLRKTLASWRAFAYSQRYGGLIWRQIKTDEALAELDRLEELLKGGDNDRDD